MKGYSNYFSNSNDELISDRNSNLHMYLKNSNKITDRLAAYVVSDKAMQSKELFNRTVLLIGKGGSGNRIRVMSNICLNYESLIALIYMFRLDGYITYGIANISCDKYGSILALENLNTPDKAVIMTVDDYLIDLKDIDIKRSLSKLNDIKYISRMTFSDNMNNINLCKYICNVIEHKYKYHQKSLIFDNNNEVICTVLDCSKNTFMINQYSITMVERLKGNKGVIGGCLSDLQKYCHISVSSIINNIAMI